SLVLLFPACAGGGYGALSPEMMSLWMVQISEARSLPVLAADNIAMLATSAGAAAGGLVAAIFYLRKHWRHAESWLLLGFLVTAWVMLMWQIRGAALATAFAIPFGGWAVARARQAFRIQPNAIRALTLVGVAGSSASAAWAGAGVFAQQRLTP